MSNRDAKIDRLVDTEFVIGTGINENMSTFYMICILVEVDYVYCNKLLFV